MEDYKNSIIDEMKVLRDALDNPRGLDSHEFFKAKKRNRLVYLKGVYSHLRFYQKDLEEC